LALLAFLAVNVVAGRERLRLAVLGYLCALGVVGVSPWTTTASNAEDAETAENGALQVNANGKSRDVPGGLCALGAERGTPCAARGAVCMPVRHMSTGMPLTAWTNTAPPPKRSPKRPPSLLPLLPLLLPVRLAAGPGHLPHRFIEAFLAERLAVELVVGLVGLRHIRQLVVHEIRLDVVPP
jgi:hypothetical protein